MIDCNVFQSKDTIFCTLMSSLTCEASTRPSVKSGVQKYWQNGSFLMNATFPIAVYTLLTLTVLYISAFVLDFMYSDNNYRNRDLLRYLYGQS